MPDRKEEFQCRAEDAKQAVIARLGAGDGDGTAASSAFVAPGWVLDEQGRFMRELKPHMGRRLRGWDYRRPGYYMITLVMADRREGKFGELVVKQPTACAAGTTIGADPATGQFARAESWLSIDEARALGLEPEQVEAKVIFSSLGRTIFEHFKKMGAFTPGLEPVYCLARLVPERRFLRVLHVLDYMPDSCVQRRDVISFWRFKP